MFTFLVAYIVVARNIHISNDKSICHRKITLLLLIYLSKKNFLVRYRFVTKDQISCHINRLWVFLSCNKCICQNNSWHFSWEISVIRNISFLVTNRFATQIVYTVIYTLVKIFVHISHDKVNVMTIAYSVSNKFIITIDNNWSYYKLIGCSYWSIIG